MQHADFSKASDAGQVRVQHEDNIPLGGVVGAAQPGTK